MDQFWYCGFLNICLRQGKFLLPLDFLIITALITQSCLYLSRSPAASEPYHPHSLLMALFLNKKQMFLEIIRCVSCPVEARFRETRISHPVDFASLGPLIHLLYKQLRTELE